jgi:hypothetical protein
MKSVKLQFLNLRGEITRFRLDLHANDEISQTELDFVKGIALSVYKLTENTVEYGTNTFRCKSDVDHCLDNATSIIEKTLCYALFARCILKG